MNCSTTKQLLRKSWESRLDGKQKASVEAHLRACAECREEAEFDQSLREMDDFYGDAPGLRVPANFLSRVVEQARASRLHLPALPERKPLWNWFLDFGLPVRLAVVSMLLLTMVGGLRAGQVISNLLTRADQPNPPVITPDALPAEQALVMLMRSEGLIVPERASQANGEQQ